MIALIRNSTRHIKKKVASDSLRGVLLDADGLYDTSQLPEVVIDKDILKQSARFQMKK